MLEYGESRVIDRGIRLQPPIAPRAFEPFTAWLLSMSRMRGCPARRDQFGRCCALPGRTRWHARCCPPNEVVHDRVRFCHGAEVLTRVNPAERPGAQSHRSNGRKSYDSGIAGTNDIDGKSAGIVETLPETRPPIAVRCIPRVSGVWRLALMRLGRIGRWKTEMKWFIRAEATFALPAGYRFAQLSPIFSHWQLA